MNDETKPKCAAAVALGKLNKGIPRRFSPEELAKRTQRLRDYQAKRKQAEQARVLCTCYFTFGQSHVHSVDGVTYDKDSVVKITAVDPRQVMFDTFGRQWSMQYDTPPRMDLFPRGIIELKC